MSKVGYNSSWLCGIVVLALSATQLSAGLSFDRVVIEDVVAPGKRSYPFEFPFKNTGDTVVEISGIKMSCGCTSAKLDKRSYAPGESGVIQGRFSVGSRRGMQEKKIRVLTKDPAQPEIHLALKLDIPQLVRMKPRLLLWHVGTEPEAKTLTIIPNTNFGAEIVSVECASPDFAIEESPKAEGSDKYEVIVVPLKAEAGNRGLIKITVAVADAAPKIVYAHALIR